MRSPTSGASSTCSSPPRTRRRGWRPSWRSARRSSPADERSMTMPDAAAQAYRRSVLDALGADDPAEVTRGEADAWRRLIAEAGPDLATRPAEGEWSVLELLGHMADAELVMSTRYRWVLAEHEPAVAGYDQDAWVAAFHVSGDDPGALLELFAALRRANLDLWLATPEGAGQR